MVDCLVVFAGLVGTGPAAELLVTTRTAVPASRLVVLRSEFERAVWCVDAHVATRPQARRVTRRWLVEMDGGRFPGFSVLPTAVTEIGKHGHRSLPAVAASEGVDAYVTFSAELLAEGSAAGVRICSPKAWLEELWRGE